MEFIEICWPTNFILIPAAFKGFLASTERAEVVDEEELFASEVFPAGTCPRRDFWIQRANARTQQIMNRRRSRLQEE